MKIYSAIVFSIGILGLLIGAFSLGYSAHGRRMRSRLEEQRKRFERRGGDDFQWPTNDPL